MSRFFLMFFSFLIDHCFSEIKGLNAYLERAEKVGVPQAAKDLEIAESLLYSWRAKRKQGGTPLEHQKLQQAELTRLKRENEHLQEENAFLKKVATYFTKESK